MNSSPKFLTSISVYNVYTLALVLAVLSACAGVSGPKNDNPNAHQVGRLKVVADSPKWREVSISDGAIGVRNHGADANQNSMKQTQKVLYLQDEQGVTQSLLAFSSTYGAGSNMIRQEFHCAADNEKTYVADFSGYASKVQPACVRAWQRVSSASLLENSKNLKAAVQKENLKLPSAVNVVYVHVMNGMGASTTVQAVVGLGLKGTPSDKTPVGTLPMGMAAEFATWADNMGWAAKEATSSLSGEFVLPAANYAEAATAAASK
jgi:hypothetical protein